MPLPGNNPFATTPAQLGCVLLPNSGPVGPAIILQTGNIWYVQSTNSAAANKVGNGTSPASPFSTLNFALTQCIANNGDIIYVMPGHVETVASAAALTFATGQCDGVTVIFCGNAVDRALINFATSTAAQVTITANNVTLINPRFQGSIDALVAAVSITGSDCTMLNVEYIDIASVSSLIQIITTNAANRLTINGYTYYEPSTVGSQKTEMIRIVGGTNHRLTSLNAVGNFSTAIVNNVTTATKQLQAAAWLFTNTNSGGAPYALVAATTLSGGDYSPLATQQAEQTIVSPAAKTIPQTATQTIFTFTGIIEVLDVGGVITTAIGGTATNLKFSVNVNSLGSVDVCAAAAITSMAVGGVLRPITSFATALGVASPATIGVVDTTAKGTTFVAGGIGVVSIITVNTSASTTGACQYFLRYRPLSQGVVVTAN